MLNLPSKFISEMLKDNKNKLLIVAGAILLISLTRLIPHVSNYTAIGAAAIFGGATLRNKFIAVLIPVLSMFLTDLVLNNVVYSAYFDGFQFVTPGFGFTVAALLLMVIAGSSIIKQMKAGNVIGASFAASLIFFLVSNFGVWLTGTTYTKDIYGLFFCYEMGLPFFLNTLLGTLFYSGVTFFGYSYVSKNYPAILSK